MGFGGEIEEKRKKGRRRVKGKREWKKRRGKEKGEEGRDKGKTEGKGGKKKDLHLCTKKLTKNSIRNVY